MAGYYFRTYNMLSVTSLCRILDLEQKHPHMQQFCQKYSKA